MASAAGVEGEQQQPRGAAAVAGQPPRASEGPQVGVPLHSRSLAELVPMMRVLQFIYEAYKRGILLDVDRLRCVDDILQDVKDIVYRPVLQPL